MLCLAKQNGITSLSLIIKKENDNNIVVVGAASCILPIHRHSLVDIVRMRVLCMYTDLPGIRKWPDAFLSPPRRQSPVPCDRSRVVSLRDDEVSDICCSVPARADWLPPCNIGDGHDAGIHNKCYIFGSKVYVG